MTERTEETEIALLQQSMKTLELNLEANFRALDRKIDDATGEIRRDLAELNGTVATNTRWRWMMVGAGSVLMFFIGTGSVTVLAVAMVQGFK